MTNRVSAPNVYHNITPDFALLLLEEGVAIKVSSDHIYQRNHKLNFFNYRKWRKTEDYAIQNESRDKVYCFETTHFIEAKILSKQEFIEQIKDYTDITIIPPIGFKYTPKQIKCIYIESNRIINNAQNFIDTNYNSYKKDNL